MKGCFFSMGVLSFFPGSTLHPSLSASAVRQKEDLTASNPKTVAWAAPSFAIILASEWASGQAHPTASICPMVADWVKTATGGLSRGSFLIAASTLSLGVIDIVISLLGWRIYSYLYNHPYPPG